MSGFCIGKKKVPPPPPSKKPKPKLVKEVAASPVKSVEDFSEIQPTQVDAKSPEVKTKSKSVPVSTMAESKEKLKDSAVTTQVKPVFTLTLQDVEVVEMSAARFDVCAKGNYQ